MGNEGSQLNGLELDDKSIEVTDFWAQYQAKINDSCRYFGINSDGSVSVFKGQSVMGPLWAVSSPLEKCSNNLLKFRHPYIVRYISAWKQHSTLYLATEYVQPLAQVLSKQTPLQLCVGLHNILQALYFLHDQATMSHNNICVSSIYVTADGQWKLGGLQYLCPYKELTSSYLKQARIHRYDKAVDPCEDSYEQYKTVDHYGFAALVESIMKNYQNDEVPYLEEFKLYCHSKLQNSDPSIRPAFSEVLQHPFFNHEFISIYKFLTFLALKSEEEKCVFFSTILENLRNYDEETVAKQFCGLLLSRMTLLDGTARRDVIPCIFMPKNERLQSGNIGFFSLDIFKEHVKPRIIQLFAVRDSQIRLLLLAHFSKFVQVFSHDELSQHILPELLLGIKDIDDNLVSATLVCLSELIPILGADAVVGGKRSKLFTDGRPNPIVNLNSSSQHKSGGNIPKALKDLTCSESVYTRENIDFNKPIELRERPSPVGGESVDDFRPLENTNHCESEDDWSDWDKNQNSKVTEFNGPPGEVHLNDENSSLNHNLHEAGIVAKKKFVDISELDIKNQKYEKSNQNEDFDFFADMTPVIEKPQIINVAQEISNKLSFIPDEKDDVGWDDNWTE